MTASAARVQAHRRRLREGRILLPRIELTREHVDALVEAGLLGAWDDADPEAIAAAVVVLLERLGNDVTA